jgi:hypothetical protein
MFNFTKIENLTITSFFTLLMAGTLLAQTGTAATFKFSDFAFTRASSSPTNEFHNKVFYQTQKTTTDKKGKSTTVTTNVKGVAAFQQFVLKEATAIDLNTLDARKLDATKLKLKFDKKINIYFIDEGAGYRNQLKLVAANGSAAGTNKEGLVFYDGSKGSGANELLAGDYVSVGDNLSNNDVVKAGTILDFQLRANGFNTSDNTSRSSADVWYTDKTKNVDQLQHVIAYEYEGFLVLAWEDLKNGGDKDYNDIVFAVDIGQANLDAIPDEPPANQAPNAKDDIGNTGYGASVPIDVLANDSDPENSALTITSASSLTGATVAVVNGKVQYTPASDFNIAGGSDSFSYTIKDAQGATGTATVTISVGAKPTPPPTAGLSCKSNNGGGNNADITITLSTGKTLTISKFDPSNPGNGNQLDKKINDASPNLTPAEFAAAKAQLLQLINDVEKKGGATGAGCTPPPNQAPSALADNGNTPHKTAVVIDVLANDVDPEGQALTIDSVNSTTGATVQIVTEGGKQQVKYTPKSNFVRAGGEDSFTYTIKDTQGASSSATVTVYVGQQPNQAPVAVADEVSTGHKTAVTVDVMANDSDPDGDPFSIDSVYSSTGSKVEITTDGKVKYTPRANFGRAAGTESFTYTIKDNQGDTSSATVTVNIGAKPNEAPEAQDDQMSTAYGALVTVDVMANDTDPDEQTISIKNVTSTTGATVQVVDGKVQYTPKANFARAGGSDTFTYTIEDIQGATDSATVTVAVAAKPNGAPNAVDDQMSTAYGTPVSVDVLANDTDPENDSFFITSVTSSTGATVQVVNGRVEYTPKSDFNTEGGDDTFTYMITDSEGDTDSATVTVSVAEKPGTDEQQQPEEESGGSISD